MSTLTPHGTVPAYVPPHLQGKVWDFRGEPDGNISFRHPETSLGLSPSTDRVTLTPEQYGQTFDPVTRNANPVLAAQSQYAPMQRMLKTPARQMNEAIGNGLSKAYDWSTATQGRALGTAGLLSALVGGLGGYLWDREDGEGGTGNALLAALIAGGLGAGGTALAQHAFNRRNEWQATKQASDDPIQLLIRALESDPTLSGTDRATILRAMTRLDVSGQQTIMQLARSAAGVGLGVLIMRFLGAKGLLPMLAGGIIGGMIGGRQPAPERNALGQLSILNYR